jgi:Spy/CpxP family protein refolding chaperone
MRGVGIAMTVPIVALGLVLASPSPAERRFGRGHHGPGGPPPDLIEQHADRLGLDEETREAIEEIVEESRDRGEDLQEALHDAHREMHELLSDDVPDPQRVMDKAERIGALETEERKHRLSAMLRIRALLTPEQREELLALHREERESRFAPIRDECGEDIERMCPGLEPGRELGTCLREHRDELSSGCVLALENYRPWHRRGPHGPSGDF